MTSLTPTIDAWVTRSQNVLIPTYRRRPIAFSRGQGARLWATDGTEFIDFCSGIASCSLGHGSSPVSTAIADQVGTLMHVSNLYEIPEQVELAERLAAFTGFDRFFFCNSGTEANEALLKLVRAWGNREGRHQVVVARDGFHGRTMGALSATGQPALQEAFGPMLDGFTVVDFGEIESVRQALAAQPTAAVYLEPVQAEGGGNLPPDAYLSAVRELCDSHGSLLVFDEVQMGMGRTGYPLAQDAFGVRADAVALAKGLGGGFPLGALGIREHLLDVLQPGSHGSTFGGNPLACVAGRAVVDTLSADGVLARVRERGERLLSLLQDAEGPVVQRPRGAGLFVCFNTDDPAAVVDAAQARGLLLVGAKHNAVRLLPPLTISDQEFDEGIERLSATLEATSHA